MPQRCSNKTVGKAQKPLGPQIMKCRGAGFKVSSQFGSFGPWDWDIFSSSFPIMFPKGITWKYRTVLSGSLRNLFCWAALRHPGREARRHFFLIWAILGQGHQGSHSRGGGSFIIPPHYFPHFCKRNHMKISSHSPRIPSEPIFPKFFGLGGPPGVPLGVVIHHLTLSSPFPSLL